MRPFHDAKAVAVRQFEVDYLSELLTEHHGNFSAAARTADVDRTTLYRMAERLGLKWSREWQGFIPIQREARCSPTSELE